MTNINTEYELLTKDIYEVLLKNDGVTVEVLHDVEIQGKHLSTKLMFTGNMK
nr:hypothetical protein [uncultured Flavobacterium sp.]